jgi:hypothetical protein
MATNRTKAETEELAKEVAIVLRWYFDSRLHKLPNSDPKELSGIPRETYKKLVYQVLRDEAQMSEEENVVFMTAFEFNISKLGIECITVIEVKKKLKNYGI